MDEYIDSYDIIRRKCSSIERHILNSERKVTRATHQLDVISEQLDMLHVRYLSAKRDGCRHFYAGLRIRMSTLQGIKCAYRKYSEHYFWKVCQLYGQLNDMECRLDHMDSASESDTD